MRFQKDALMKYLKMKKERRLEKHKETSNINKKKKERK